MGTKTFWHTVYRTAIDDNENLERRWEALRKLIDREIYNPHLGDLEMFMNENRGLVADVVRKSMRKTKLKVDFDDLMQEGWIGFIKAYSRYTPAKSTKFSTYAYYHMSNEIMRYIAERLPMIRVPRGIYELGGKILKNRLGNSSAEEISEKLGCTVKAAERALENLKGNIVLSLNAVVSDSATRDAELMDILPQDHDFTNLDVLEFFESLDDELKQTLQMAMENKSQSQIGKVLGCSQVQAGRLIKRIRTRAKEYFGEVTA